MKKADTFIHLVSRLPDLLHGDLRRAPRVCFEAGERRSPPVVERRYGVRARPGAVVRHRRPLRQEREGGHV